MVAMTETAPPSGIDMDEVDALLVRTRRRTRWQWFAVAVAIAVVAGLAYSAASGFGRDPSLVRSPLLGKLAPAFRLPALDGGDFDSGSWQGQVVVVNFWASWCVPCQQEAPELQAFSQRWAGRGVQMVGIVYNDDTSKAAAFRDRNKLTYPQLLDRGGRTAIDFGVFGVPETYVIGPDGKVMAKLLGAVNASTLENVVASVKSGQTVSTRNDRYRTGPGP